MHKRLFASVLAFGLALPAVAQLAMPPVDPTPFRDTSLLKPPPSAKVAIIEFEDLQCPLCAHDASLVRGAAAKYNIPLVHHDFIIESHPWSRAAAINARYLEDKVSPKAAEAFRLDVFAHQQSISSKDDLDQFTRRWFQAHGQAMPFLIDPAQRCALEVQADCTLGEPVRHTAHPDDSCSHGGTLDRGDRRHAALRGHRPGRKPDQSHTAASLTLASVIEPGR